MMIKVDTNDKSEQRKFGVTMAIAITVLGMIRWLFHGFAWEDVPVYFLAVAAVFLVLGLIAPRTLGPVFWFWIKLSIVLNWIMTRVFLGITFFLILTPIALIHRFSGNDPLKRKWLPESESYWEAPEEQPAEFDRYKNQF